MNQYVSHPGHHLPRNFGVPVSKRFSEAFYSLSNYLELADDGRLAYRIGGKVFKGAAFDELHRFPRRDKDIFDVSGVINVQG